MKIKNSLQILIIFTFILFTKNTLAINGEKNSNQKRKSLYVSAGTYKYPKQVTQLPDGTTVIICGNTETKVCATTSYNGAGQFEVDEYDNNGNVINTYYSHDIDIAATSSPSVTITIQPD